MAQHIGIGEASRLLGISVSRLRQLVNDGLLSAGLTAGGHRRFDPAQLRREWLRLRQRGTPTTWMTSYPLAGLAEDRVWSDIRAELETYTGSIPERARRILGYATTEMANNAIDHSYGTTLDVALIVDSTGVQVRLTDDGIGAFRSISDTFGYEDVADAVVDLTKGKRTSDPSRHSGEGIFFTSKAVDRFTLAANGYLFAIDNLKPDAALGVGVAIGTTVELTLDLNTDRDLIDVFAAFTEGGEFVRTTPLVKLLDHGSEFLSRSQAKRFALGMEQFQQVVLDFTGVDLLGQGFADELFRVWQAEHPKVTLEVVGANPGVELMINRVAKP